jgi:Putative beta barrel porin-7 (BBP7)
MFWKSTGHLQGVRCVMSDRPEVVSGVSSFKNRQVCLHVWLSLGIIALAMGIWLIGPAQAFAQTPVWQQPPTTEPFNDWASQPDSVPGPVYSRAPSNGCESVCQSGSSCGNENDAGCACDPICRPSCGIINLLQHDWFRAEALLWWTNGGNIPPLLTSSPVGTSSQQAGVLGQPGTVVLLGNQELNNDFRGGGRISFGTWLDDCENVGLEFTYLILGQSVDGLTITNAENPILARPFFDTDTGAENSHLIAFPGTQRGAFSFTSTSNFQVAEFLVRRAIARGCGYRIETLGGYRFQRLSEGLDINDTSTLVSSNQSIQVFDEFHARNDFNGGEVGFSVERHGCRWSYETNLKLALGNTHSSIDINGSTTTPTGTTPGGLLAQASNMGPHYSNQFSIIPELGFTVGYDLTCNLRAVAGYSIIYWSNVTRPGDQIDLVVSLPPQTSAKPAFTQHTSDFWAQGINIGLDYRF